MSYLSSLPDDAKLMNVFQLYPETSRPLLDYHEIVMRGPSPFSVAERELIAAYVSGVNSCDYCHGVHTAAAELLSELASEPSDTGRPRAAGPSLRGAVGCGIERGAVPAALDDLDAAPVAGKMRPVLRYVGKLTRTPAAITRADAEEVLAAGWDERALHYAVMVCALFNFMNRMVEGHGISAGPDYFAESGTRLVKVGYAGLNQLLDG